MCLIKAFSTCFCSSIDDHCQDNSFTGAMVTKLVHPQAMAKKPFFSFYPFSMARSLEAEVRGFKLQDEGADTEITGLQNTVHGKNLLLQKAFVQNARARSTISRLTQELSASEAAANATHTAVAAFAEDASLRAAEVERLHAAEVHLLEGITSKLTGLLEENAGLVAERLTLRKALAAMEVAKETQELDCLELSEDLQEARRAIRCITEQANAQQLQLAECRTKAHEEAKTWQAKCDATDKARLAAEAETAAAEDRAAELKKELHACDKLTRGQKATIAALERKLLEKEEELQHLADRKFPLCLPSTAHITLEENGELGSGGFATVHSACVSFTVAAKVAHDAEEDSDLEAEAAMMAAIPAHPGVIACCGLAHVQGLEGRALLLEKADYSLQDLLESGVELRARSVLHLCKELIEAAQHIYRSGFFHRDIKPGNILLKDNILKLADLGCGIDRKTDTRIWMGTWPYMTPQTQLGDRPGVYDDIRAVSITLYELLSGKCPITELLRQYDDIYSDNDISAQIQELRSAKGVAHDRSTKMPAAEALGAIGIREMSCQYEDVPQQLLDAVLKGINTPRKLSFAVLKSAVEAALACCPETIRPVKADLSRGTDDVSEDEASTCSSGTRATTGAACSVLPCCADKGPLRAAPSACAEAFPSSLEDSSPDDGSWDVVAAAVAFCFD